MSSASAIYNLELDRVRLRAVATRQRRDGDMNGLEKTKVVFATGCWSWSEIVPSARPIAASYRVASYLAGDAAMDLVVERHGGVIRIDREPTLSSVEGTRLLLDDLVAPSIRK